MGIYLVGWFDTAKWDADDSRRLTTPKIMIDEVRRRLHEQAAAAPTRFLVRAIMRDCHAP
jgi:hypothetical protein